MKVSQIMSSRVVTVTPSDSVAYAETLMSTEQIRHLPVVDGDVLVGVLSQRDIVGASISTVNQPTEDDDRDLKRRLKVSEIMRSFVETARPGADVIEAADKLLDYKIGCLPIVDERQHVMGIVTEADFVRLVRELLKRYGSRV